MRLGFLTLNDMIDLTIPTDKVVTVLNPDGSVLVETDNMLLFDSIRVQIAEQKLTGYSCLFEGKTIKIDKNGRCDSYPKGFFDTATNLLFRLL